MTSIQEWKRSAWGSRNPSVLHEGTGQAVDAAAAFEIDAGEETIAAGTSFDERIWYFEVALEAAPDLRFQLFLKGQGLWY